MKKRGISPLISTILIISFTIVIAAFVFVWGSDTFVKYKEKTEFESIGSLECATKIAINIKKACILGDEVQLQIENVGGRDIDSFLFRTKGANNVNLFELDKTSGVYSSNLFEAEFDANSMTGLINPNEIDVFPRLLIQNKYFTCDKTSINIKPCYLLPRLNTFEDWSIVEGMKDQTGVIPENMLEDNNLDPGIGIFLANSGKIEIKSNIFTIPNDVDNFHIRGKTSESGSITYNLKYENGDSALSTPLSTSNGIIVPTRTIFDLKEKSVYLSITLEGNTGDYATLSELCYTNEQFCVI